ncbi:MAG: hypothetical protein KJ667_02790 [Alphaproteobacteria bacterium]|jgi:hypothetical protein|nr:hypothetical protein [Alphaproteobacteria bacterium]
MIIYTMVRRYVPEKYAVGLTAVIYALLLFLTFCSLSQIGADLRYANI